jgi:hypothetical protein
MQMILPPLEPDIRRTDIIVDFERGEITLDQAQAVRHVFVTANRRLATKSPPEFQRESLLRVRFARSRQLSARSALTRTGHFPRAGGA